VTPDIMTLAKGLTNGAVPMGATLVTPAVLEAFMAQPRGAPEFMHGYTYLAHPLACAAGLVTLDTVQQEGMFEASARIAEPFRAALLELQGARHVVDVRCCGLLGAVDLAPRADASGARGGRHVGAVAAAGGQRSAGGGKRVGAALGAGRRGLITAPPDHSAA